MRRPPIAKHIIWSRLEEYSDVSGLSFTQVPRRSRIWKTHGLPDTRGFAPHLGVVNTGFGETFSSLQKDRWLAHDVCHVLFYDFAVLNLGEEAFGSIERMLENHLASEAFAVYALDYRVLSGYPRKSLTIELSDSWWPSFQKLNPLLQDIASPEFCRNLVGHYLTGDVRGFELGNTVRISKAVQGRYENWAGHEIRYAVKQRVYAQMWADDLVGRRRRSPVAAVVTDSYVDEAVFELTEILLEANSESWNGFLQDLKSMKRRGPQGVFASKRLTKKPDFRFTDVLSIASERALAVVSDATKPSPQNLFLFWQLVSMLNPKSLAKAELKAVETLARSSNTKRVSTSAWTQVRKAILRRGSEFHWDVEPDRISSFFLP